MSTVAPAEAGLIEALTPVLITHEGERLHVYHDSLGIPTVGVGLALMVKLSGGAMTPSSYAKGVCQRAGVDFDSVLADTVDLTQEQSRQILSLCIIDVIEWIVVVFPAFWAFTQPRQVGILDMGFNLGETKFKEFKSMIGHITVYDWYMAAADALHSIWASQVGQRAIDDANRLRTG